MVLRLCCPVVVTVTRKGNVLIYIYVYICMHVCMYACMHACMHGWMYGCMDVWMYVCESEILSPICMFLVDIEVICSHSRRQEIHSFGMTVVFSEDLQ